VAGRFFTGSDRGQAIEYPIDKYGKMPYYKGMDKRHIVYASKTFQKQMHKLPKYIKQAVAVWVGAVELEGIREVRKFKGYHDEPLKGTREGQRSVRLSKAYRLIYEEDQKTETVTIHLLEVNKHDY
jgi:toxin HigB-1